MTNVFFISKLLMLEFHFFDFIFIPNISLGVQNWRLRILFLRFKIFCSSIQSKFKELKNKSKARNILVSGNSELIKTQPGVSKELSVAVINCFDYVQRIMYRRIAWILQSLWSKSQKITTFMYQFIEFKVIGIWKISRNN